MENKNKKRYLEEKNMEKKDEKPIEIDAWLKKAKKLNKKYSSYLELKNDCIKKIGQHYFVLIDGVNKDGANSVSVDLMNVLEGGRDHDRVHVSRDVPTYYFNKDGSLEMLNTKKLIEELVPELAKHVSVDVLVEDTLQDLSPSRLKDIHERVIGRLKEKKTTKIKQKPGCLYLSIGGKRGPPDNLFLRE